MSELDAELDAEIARCRAELAALPRGDPDRADPLERLAITLYERFEKLGGMPYLEGAITLGRTALELRPQGHPDRHYTLNNLASYLQMRCNHLGQIADLEEAITLHSSALELRPKGHPDRSASLNNLALSLHARFMNLGGITDLEEAITLNRSALQLCPQGHPDRSTSLNDLALSLHVLFENLGGIENLDEAIGFYRSALELCPQGTIHQSMTLTNLANSLHTRFEHLGGIADLNETITLHHSALELLPQGHPNRSSSLNNLANSLWTRFHSLEWIADLDEAIKLHRSALDLRPQGNPHRLLSLNNLANSLFTRFEELRGITDLNTAITLHRNALELCPQGHPYRSSSLHNIATSLVVRFNHLGGITDLEEAITLHHNALHLRPQGHPNRSSSLKNLADSLLTGFQSLGGVENLDEAITLFRSALDLRSQGHPDRSPCVQSIARCLLLRSPHELNQEVFTLYSTLSDVSQSVVAADLIAARAWVRLAEAVGHHTTLSAYQTSLRLLVTHVAALPCLPQHLGIMKHRLSSLPMDAFSASIRHHNLTNAVELLEQGRSVFWSQLTRLRSPVDDVITSGGEGQKLGERFLSISRVLRSILDSNPSDHRTWDLTTQLRETVDDIRRLPAHSRFLLPPLFSDLRKAASGGPVIIVNSSQYGRDVIVMLHDSDPIHIPLEIDQARLKELVLDLSRITKKGEGQDVQRDLVMILRELWDRVVCPVVQILKEFCPRRSRIWWCPTAEFALLPLHAAGEYRPKKPNFSDLYISSYTPTLNALIRSRRALDSTTAKPRFMAVGYGEASGEVMLENVHSELVSVCDSVQTRATFTRIEGKDAKVERVSKELQQSEFIHLACHGIPNQTEPFESGFALSDGLWKVQDIMRFDLQHTRLATLSACHTTVGDKDSPDEAIHLAAAMQFIGFRSVVGTMWAVDDAEGKKVTSEFYRIMVDMSGSGGLDHTHAAVALHKALRVAKPPLPLHQRILFIHIGA